MTGGQGPSGRDSRFCGGKLKQREGTCTRPAGWGTPHPGVGQCKLHAGSTPSHVAAAQKVLAEQALLTIWNPNAEPVTDSVSEMQRLAGSLRAAVDVLGSRLDLGEPCEACGRGAVDLDSAHAVAWVRVLRELRTILAEMERLGIAHRQVEVSEAVAGTVVAAFQLGLGAIVGLLPGDRDAALRAFLGGLGRGQVLEELEAGGGSAGTEEEE